jgi:hypothetical protein
MQPTEVADATRQLDALATRVENLIATESPNLSVTAPGRDEVSARVASTLNAVHAGFTKSMDQGANEIREMAATLRAHTDNVMVADQDFVV